MTKTGTRRGTAAPGFWWISNPGDVNPTTSHHIAPSRRAPPISSPKPTKRSSPADAGLPRPASAEVSEAESDPVATLLRPIRGPAKTKPNKRARRSRNHPYHHRGPAYVADEGRSTVPIDLGAVALAAIIPRLACGSRPA